jgi:hypothetical protein
MVGLSARLRNVALSGTIVAEYDVAFGDGGDGECRTVVRVQFPDEVRAILESSTWSRGATILDALGRLGIDYIERLGATGLLPAPPVTNGVMLRPPPTYHLPLSYLRAWWRGRYVAEA